MKKMFVAAVAVLLVLALAACSGPSAPSAAPLVAASPPASLLLSVLVEFTSAAAASFRIAWLTVAAPLGSCIPPVHPHAFPARPHFLV